MNQMPAVPPALVDVAAFYATFDFTIDLCRAALSGLGGAGVEEQEGGGKEEEFFHAGFLWLDGRRGRLKPNNIVDYCVNQQRCLHFRLLLEDPFEQLSGIVKNVDRHGKPALFLIMADSCLKIIQAKIKVVRRRKSVNNATISYRIKPVRRCLALAQRERFSKVLKHQVNRFRTICTVCGFVALS